jgi:hypothetical protein
MPPRRLRARLVFLRRKSPSTSRATEKPKAIINSVRYSTLWPVIGMPVGTPVGLGSGVGEGCPVIGSTSDTWVGVSVGTGGNTVGCAGTIVAVGDTGIDVGVSVGVLVGVLVGILVGVSVGVSVG